MKGSNGFRRNSRSFFERIRRSIKHELPGQLPDTLTQDLLSATARGKALTGNLPPDQRIEQTERFLAERPDIRVVEISASFFDGARDPHQRLVFQGFGVCTPALTDDLQRINLRLRQ